MPSQASSGGRLRNYRCLGCGSRAAWFWDEQDGQLYPSLVCACGWVLEASPRELDDAPWAYKMAGLEITRKYFQAARKFASRNGSKTGAIEHGNGRTWARFTRNIRT